MKNSLKKILVVLSLFMASKTFAQQITLEFANAHQSSPDGGVTVYYEVDVLISSTVDFIVGSGQIYLNYNTDAFGTNVSTNGSLTYDHGINGGGYILDEYYSGVVPVYQYFVQNDNTTSRVSLSFGQAIGSDVLSPNVTATPTLLLHAKILYLDPNEPANIEFESNPPFDTLFFTACGGNPSADCTNEPGSQIIDDTFDSSNSDPVLLSVDDNELQELQIIPNPIASDFQILGLHELSSISLYGINGKLIFEQDNYLGETLNISSLKSGIYLLKIAMEKGVIVKKLVKR